LPPARKRGPGRGRRRRRRLMAREWSDLLALPASMAPPADEADGEDGGARRRGLLRRLRQSLGATREAIGVRRTLARHDWEGLEEALIVADVGVATEVAVARSCSRS